ELITAGHLCRVFKTDMKTLLHLADEDRTVLIGITTYGDHIVPRFVDIIIHLSGMVVADVETRLPHHLHSQGMHLRCRVSACGANLHVCIKRLQKGMCHLAAAAVAGA